MYMYTYICAAPARRRWRKKRDNASPLVEPQTRLLRSSTCIYICIYKHI